jgi:hypothetical protein
MRIDIVGNIKIMSPLRLRYFLAVMKSLECLNKISDIYLNIENGKYIIKPLRRYLRSLGFEKIYLECSKGNYGDIYCSLIRRTSSQYILNIEDDHFCMLDETAKLEKIIEVALKHKTEIIPTTFFKMLTENYSILNPFYSDELCKIYAYNSETFDKLGYGDNDIVVGNNCIFSREFALRHWGMEHESHRPHPFEEQRKNLQEEHLQLMMPKFEILRPIDDDHGVKDSSCIANPGEKWNGVFNEMNILLFLPWVINYKVKKLLK